MKMKYYLVMAMSICMVSACNSNEGTTEETAPATAPVQNVNGNIPDTTNTTNMDGTQPVDSSRVRDSLRK